MSTDQLRHILEHRGPEAAFDAACEKIRQLDAHLEALWNSRFLEVRILEDGGKKLWPTTERMISQTYDLQDLNGEPIPEFFYCAEDGQLYPVTLGGREPISSVEEVPFHYASSELVANGQVVGHVIHTDH